MKDSKKIELYAEEIKHVCNKCEKVSYFIESNAHTICDECFYNFLLKNGVGFLIKEILDKQ